MLLEICIIVKLAGHGSRSSRATEKARCRKRRENKEGRGGKADKQVFLQRVRDARQHPPPSPPPSTHTHTPSLSLSPNLPPFQKRNSLKPNVLLPQLGDILSQVRWAASREQGLVPPASSRTVAFRCDWKGAFMSRCLIVHSIEWDAHRTIAF